MNISVDEVKCKMCKKCISECPTKSLALTEGKISQVAPTLCLACGHCAAVCMENALSWNTNITNRSFELTDYPNDNSHVINIFKKTRSIRMFKSDKIDKDTIVKLISYAETAPSGDNFRKREYIVVNDSESIDKMELLLFAYFNKLVRFLPSFVIKVISLYSKTLAEEVKFITAIIKSHKARDLEEDRSFFRNAPCVIFITGPKKSMLANDDCVAAQNYMRLAGTTMGIGSCIIGFAQKSKGLLEMYLGIDKNKKIYAATIFGFQSNKYLKSIDYPKPSINWK